MEIVHNKICLSLVDDYNMVILKEDNIDDEIQLPLRAYEKLKRFLNDGTICDGLIFRVKIEILDALPTDEEAGDGLIHPADKRYDCVLSKDQPYETAGGDSS
jgi:hypothetical protein